MMIEQRLPFGSVWDGDEELVHVVNGAFVTVPPLEPTRARPCASSRSSGGAAAPAAEQQGPDGARRPPRSRSGETRIVVSVCRTQPLSVEGVDPGASRVQVDDEPAR